MKQNSNPFNLLTISRRMKPAEGIHNKKNLPLLQRAEISITGIEVMFHVVSLSKWYKKTTNA